MCDYHDLSFIHENKKSSIMKNPTTSEMKT